MSEAVPDSIFREVAAKHYESEVVVLDNASTDATAPIPGGYPEVAIVSELRKGITFARQAGLTKSSSNLVASVDADTLLPPGWLDTVCRAFGKDERLVCMSAISRTRRPPVPRPFTSMVRSTRVRRRPMGSPRSSRSPT